jgi:hypothetical protein
VGPSAVDGFSQWLGRSVEIATTFTGFQASSLSDWSNIEGPAWQLGPWSQWVKAKSGRNISYAISLFPKGGSLASCAAGQYDVHYRNLANNLANYGLHSAYLRLGWEMDGNWYPWGAPAGSGKETSFAGCFRRVVQVMRQTQPANQWKFVFNPTEYADRTWLEATWPGDAYVDVVGSDSYDMSWVANTYPYPSTCGATCRLTRQQTAWSSQVSRINIIRDFAIAHGKPMAFPEWGVAILSDGAGGGDNPYFIQKMHEFITNPANKVVYHGFYNVSTMTGYGVDHRVTDPVQYDDPAGPTKMPNAGAMFKQLFGPGSN